MYDVLKGKHPPAVPVHHECLITDSDPALAYHPVIFEALDGSVIHAAALRTSGAVGPLGVDAYGWRCLCMRAWHLDQLLMNYVVVLQYWQGVCVHPLLILPLFHPFWLVDL